MINPVWLKTFCELVEVNHFTKTAERLFMTQSGVSQHIKKLEQQVGALLLERHGKQLTLTPQGQSLYNRGSQLLKEWQFLEQQIKNDSPFEGRVKIQSPGSCGLKFYNELLSLQSKHPKLFIEYAFAPNSGVEKAIASHQIDIGFMSQAPTMLEVTGHKIANEPLLLITPAQFKTIDWQQLCQLGFINHPDGKHHAQQLLSANFAEFESIAQFECSGFSNQINLILEPVSLGLGFTVLPAHAVSAFHNQEKIHVHTLTHPVCEDIYACHHRNRPLAKRMKTVINEIKSL